MSVSIENPALYKIWEDRYRNNNETIQENIERVIKACATNDEEEQLFRWLMWENGYGFPAGRTMSNAGLGTKLTMNNCFVCYQIPNDMSGIFDCVKLGALTHKAGGGIGYDFSLLSPNGTKTNNNATASGVVSFMEVFDAETKTIEQGSRRGANMGVLNVYHPDIFEFVMAKANDKNALTQFNMSVMVDDNFMNAVNNDEKIFLHYPVYDKTGRTLNNHEQWEQSMEVSAKELWELITFQAYNTGEPGILQYDNMNKDNNLWYIENIVGTNPCGEYLAGTLYKDNSNAHLLTEDFNQSNYGGACNLGSLFLHKFVDKPYTEHARVKLQDMMKATKVMVRLLDNIIDINKFPNEIYEKYQKSFRTIGLGTTGLADMLAMMGLKYGSSEAVDLVNKIYDLIACWAYEESIELAKEKGSFELIDREKFVSSGFIERHVKEFGWSNIYEDIKKYGIRNARILSQAPCGTLSLTFGNNCSSGIEPIFKLEQRRKVRIGGQADDNEQTISVKNYAYDIFLKTEDKTVDEDVFVTALDLTVDQHIDMLNAVAKHIDMSVSKTINVPADYPFEDAKRIYMKCWELGIKGCTIFRPNEIRQGIYITENEEKPSCITELKRGDILEISDDLIGYKSKITTGCGTIHLENYFDDFTGEPFETFINIGSSGGCERNYQFISRLISLCLRAGVPIEAIIDQGKSIRPCKAYTDRTKLKGDTSPGTSCPSAIAIALEILYHKMQDRCFTDAEDNEEEVKGLTAAAITCPENKDKLPEEYIPNTLKCPECGEELTMEGGCIVCYGCGYSKCE